MGLVQACEGGFQLDGQPFVPWGAAWFRPYTGWAPQLWSTFSASQARDDLARLRDLGANVVRAFTTWKWFLAPDGDVNEQGMERLEILLDIAWYNGIRLLITGPDHWEGAPDFLQGATDLIFDAPMQHARLAFWQEMGRRYRDDERIFAYYVANEPWVGAHTALWRRWQPLALQNGWPEHFNELPPNDWACPAGRLALEQLRHSIANEWLEHEVTAIRGTGTRTPVSCGFFPMVLPYYAFMSCGINLSGPARMLDFLSVHLYPNKPNTPEDYRREIDRQVLTASYAASFGKPLMIGEYGCVGGVQEAYSAPWGSEYLPTSEDLQALWCHDFVLATSPYASGWLCWGMYDIPESLDSTRHSGLFTADGRAKAWAEQFQGMAQQVSRLKTNAHLPRVTFDSAALYAGSADPFSGLNATLRRLRLEGDFILAENEKQTTR